MLALKLAEAALLAEALGEKPVILLDDVMSELDADVYKRQPTTIAINNYYSVLS